MKTPPRFTLLLAVAAQLLPVLPVAVVAQTPPSDPRITSWFTTPSGRYARLYETEAAKNASTAVTTWSRGQGTQSTPSYAGVMQVSYSADWVYLRSSGLGYHTMGPWYLNAAHTQLFPNYPANQNVLYRIPRVPSVPATKTLTAGGAIGYFVDGVALFDNRDTYSYTNASASDASPMGTGRGDGIWNRDAYVNEGVTFDAAFAHQAGSNYHYHANTPALRYLLGDNVDYDAATKTYPEKSTAATRHSPILGWVADGYPIYGPYGYASPLDPASGVRRMNPGYVKRDGTNGTTNLTATGRTTLPAWAMRALNRSSATLPTNLTGPAVGTAQILGHYLEDYDYLGELGKTQGADFDLDLHNGRFCVTPEFPEGTYAYFLTIEADGTPKFPYTLGRWFYGNPTGAIVQSISETATEHVRSGQAAAIIVTAVKTDSGVVLSWSSVEGGTYAISTSSDGTTFTSLTTGVTSAGLTTTHTTTTIASYYRVTLTALASYDTRGTGGLSGLNGAGNVQLPTQSVGSSGTARLINVATRVQVGGAAATPITGFVIGGSGTKNVIARAVGPGLSAFGVNGTLADPSLALVSGSTTVASNDNWSASDATALAASGAFALTAGSRDAALVSPLPSGSYSVVVGAGGGSGVALLEVYDGDASASTARLVNVSTRAFVGTGEQVLIPGFVVGGEGTARLLIRAVGPGLANFGVSGTLADPQMTLLRGATTVATNDNWSSATNATEVASAAMGAGAFALPGGSRDAALLVDLAAGAYTVAVSGVGATTGAALVELYLIQ
ncbi:MAG: YHYH protein [Verrucomicrobiota bacterium]